VVPWRRKARILADALVVAAQRAASTAAGGMLEEGEFLLAAVPGVMPALPVAAAPVESPRERARWPQVEDRVVWLVDLFERLERRDAAAAAETANLS
jgi:hypothetical protein